MRSTLRTFNFMMRLLATLARVLFGAPAARPARKPTGHAPYGQSPLATLMAAGYAPIGGGSGARTELFVRKQPGGVYTIAGLEQHPGDIFFVHSGTGTNGAGYGRNPDAPLATIDYAVGLCTADKGDVIYVLPGHAEVVSAAAGLDLDVAGISIIGLGNGSLQPTVTLDTIVTADVDVDAANITVENIHFIADFADITAAIDVNADNFTLRKCRFTGDNAGKNAKIWVQDAAAGGSDRITIEDCYCLDRDAANTHFVNFAGTGDGHIVRRNTLLGDWGTGAIAGAGVITNCVITDNVISNAATDADSGINLAAGATGLVMRNLVGIALAGDVTTGVTAAGCALAQNYVVDTGADRQAVLDPVAT
jgi:hypothetical protein